MEWKGKNVLVTGGTGFIGSFLVEELLKRGAHVRVPMRGESLKWLEAHADNVGFIKGDITNPEDCRKFVAGIDHVFHLASERRNIKYHQEHSDEVHAANVSMTNALINALRDTLQVPVIFFSTANIQQVEGEKDSPKDGYTSGKEACEALWIAAAEEQGFPLLIVRPPSVYGPRDSFGKEANVIPALIMKAAESNDTLEVWGDGTQKRMFLYVEDIPKALMKLLDSEIEDLQYIHPGNTVTVKELAEHIRDCMHPGLPLSFDTSKPQGSSYAPLPAVSEVLSAFQWTSLADGIQKTVEWWNAEQKKN